MKKIVFCLIGLAFLLPGCSGGGSSSDAPAPDMEAGTWAGVAVDQFGTYENVAVVSPDGKFNMLSITDSTLYAGTVSGSSGTFKAYFIDGTMGSGSFSFNVDGRNMTGSYTIGGVNGTATFSYISELAGPSSLQMIQGTWRQEYSATDWVQVEIAGSGGVTGQDSAGCTYTGSVSIPDPEVNVYRVSLSLSACGDMSGAYDGVAVIQGTDMLAFASNPQFAVITPDFVKIAD